jgi:hypothetical protein
MADPTQAGADADPIEAAVRRLERAAALLESRIKALTARADGAAGGLFDHDRSQLASELDLARSREKELATAGAEASEALGRAIAGIRAALERGEAH